MTDVSQEIQDELQQPRIIFVPLLRIDFPSGTIASTTADRQIDYAGTSFQPDAKLRSFGGVRQGEGLRARQIDIQLSGIDDDLAEAIEKDAPLWTPAWTWIAFLDDDHKLIDAYELSAFVLGSTTLRRSDDESYWELRGESRNVLLSRSSPIKANSEVQVQRYPDDRIFDFVPKLSGRILRWGGDEIETEDRKPGGGSADPGQSDNPGEANPTNYWQER